MSLDIPEPLTAEQLNTLQNLEQSDIEIFVRNSKGRMFKGKIVEILDDQRNVRVAVFEESDLLKTTYQDIVDGEDLLMWQDEGLAEEDALEKLDAAIAKHLDKTAAEVAEVKSDTETVDKKLLN